MFATKTNMDIKLQYKMKKKKGLSTVIATVLLILLVTVSMSIVWVFVRNIITERTEGAKSCFDVESSDVVTINSYYTCYNSTHGKVQFSINIGDVEIESVIVSILMNGNSIPFVITDDLSAVPGLAPYGSAGGDVKLPGKNEGRTYVASGSGIIANSKVDSIKIAPVVEGKQCGMSDSIYAVDDCSLLE
jgi:hypothetical protein